LLDRDVIPGDHDRIADELRRVRRTLFVNLSHGFNR